jgi:transcriptional regulator GlxA family with amidase domain
LQGQANWTISTVDLAKVPFYLHDQINQPMKRLTILVPDGHHNLSGVAGTFEIFTKANEYYQRIGRQPVFDIELVSTAREIELHQGAFAIRTHRTIKNIRKTDLIIIPAVPPDFDSRINDAKSLVTWLKKMYHGGSAIASICTGAFLLASTELLNGSTCSTHWFAADQFRRMFPHVDLQPDKLITDAKRIYTNGGAFSFLNLMIYLIEKYYDRQTAIFCSKLFQVDIARHSQSPFIIFSTQKQHDDEIVKRAQQQIEKNLTEKISVDSLSKKFAVSRRNFDRRFVKATGNTPLEYSQRVKIEAAKKALESSPKTINEIMYSVGYTDINAFRGVFRKVTGMSPLDYKNRFSKNSKI